MIADEPIHPVADITHGMTKREDFAKAAMQAILTSWGGLPAIDERQGIADLAWRMADAMMESPHA